MPEIRVRDIVWTNRMTLGELVREINRTVREFGQLVTENYWNSQPQIDASIIVNTTQLIWIPQNDYVVNWVALKTSSGTASVTPRISGVDMGVSGGVPITATTTTTRYAVTSANEVEALDYIDLVVSGLGAGANLGLSLGVRRR